MSTYFGCGFLNLVVAFLQGYAENQKTLIVSLAMLGKFAISGAYAVIYLFSTEQFPTVIKNSGLGKFHSEKFSYVKHVNYFSNILKYFIQAYVRLLPVLEGFFALTSSTYLHLGNLYLF